MRKSGRLTLAVALWSMAAMSMAQEHGVAKPELLLQEIVRDMP